MVPACPLSRSGALFTLCLALSLALSLARPLALDLEGVVPNGLAYLDPDSGLTCDILDSVGCNAGAPPNAFGDGLAATGYIWTPELCAADSDGDGQSNGEELGDPCCVWVPGSTPTRTTNLSHPGDPSETNTAPAVNCSTIAEVPDDGEDGDDEPEPSPELATPDVPAISIRPPRRSPTPSVLPVMPTITPSVSASTSVSPSSSAMDFNSAEPDDEDPAVGSAPTFDTEESVEPPMSLPLSSPTMTLSASVSASLSASPSAMGVGAGVGMEESAEPSMSPNADDGPPCFPADALVRVQDSHRVSLKRMADVVVGDVVHVGGGEYSRVFMLSHADARTAKLHEFTQLTTAAGHKLTLTAGHYLYAYASGTKRLTRADGVQVGRHEVETESGRKTGVVKTERVWKTGLYNPQTLHGDIVVDGVVASTYTTAVHPGTAHSLLAPLRAVFRALQASTATLESGKHWRGWLRVLPGGEAEL